jgi:carboxyl-terminal processing protease
MKKEECDEEITRKQKNTKILIGAVIFLSFTFGWAFGHLDFQSGNAGFSPTIVNKDTNTSVDFGIFWQVWNKVVSEFDGKIDYQAMVNGAVNGMVNALGDPYTLFMTPEQTQTFDQEFEGTVSGIGAEVGIKVDRPIIVAPIDNSPAQKAGIKAQDIILSIDGVDTKGMDLSTAVSKIRGDVGTKVKLQLQRGDAKLDFEITREKVDTKSVKWEVKEGNIGYIEISRFDSNTTDLTRQATSELSGKGVKAVILDLRNNPGGFLDSAVNVTSEFLKSGAIVTEKPTARTGSVESYTASGKGKLTDKNIPMVILVNGGSASASEIVAGALQDSGRATLIGEKTFGKGSVQAIENLAGGASLRVTIAHWFTPKGKNISKEGISPDTEVKLTEDDFKALKDPQLDKAIEYLKSKIR